MSFLINIETSTTNCSVSLSLKNDLIDIFEKDSVSYSHSENLHYFISELLKKNKINHNRIPSPICVDGGIIEPIEIYPECCD